MQSAAAAIVLAAVLWGCSDDSRPTGPADTTPPGRVINLTVVEAAGDSVVLTWSAPGNDGDSGTAWRYDLRYAIEADSAIPWEEWTEWTPKDRPARAGTIERQTVHGLDSTQAYHFGLIAADVGGNRSELSNVVDEYYRAVVPDIELQWTLQAALHSFGPNISTRDLAELHFLMSQTATIRDLRGLEHCSDLQSLYFLWCPVTTLAPLEPLVNLTSLSLRDTEVETIEALRGMTELRSLSLTFGRIRDIGPVAAFSHLTTLSLVYNNVEDLSPIAGLSELRTLNIPQNKVADFSPVAHLESLETIWLSYNPVENLDFLNSLTQLRRFNAMSCGLTDLESLRGLPKLTSVLVPYNQITDLSPLIENLDFGSGDTLDVSSNPLSAEAIDEQIPALRARGVRVRY